jgi:hypothetical protein
LFVPKWIRQRDTQEEEEEEEEEAFKNGDSDSQ